MRFVVNGVGFPGGGAIPLHTGVQTSAAPLSTNPTSPAYYVLDSHGNNQYWSQQAYGVYYWSNKFCAGVTGPGGIVGTGTPNITDSITAPDPRVRFGPRRMA